MKQPVTLNAGQHIHIIGVGGSGMSAIARVLLLRGHRISGSDKHSSPRSEALKQAGATIYRGHDAAYVNGADVVIATSAVPDDHIEIVSAREQGIPVYRRSDVMSAIMEGALGVAVAGTHGKTTTTSMIVHLLLAAGHDPGYIVGGVMANTGTNAAAGKGRLFVIEADEYGLMFHGLRPQIAVLTNVEFDHPDFFETPRQLETAFADFIALLPDDGLLVACADDPAARNFARQRQAAHYPAVTYGIHNPADWQAVNIRYRDAMTKYDVLRRDQVLGTASVSVPGQHNILNSLAALIIADHEGIDFDTSAKGLAGFKGTARRFEVRGEVGGIVVIDDYAHHPTAIRLTIEAARQRYPERDLWVIWQPHTYSRTQQLWDKFLAAFSQAHHVLVTDIYAAREAPVPGVLANKFVGELDHPSKFHAPTFETAVSILCDRVRAPAVVVIMSAGDAPQIGIDYLKILEADGS